MRKIVLLGMTTILLSGCSPDVKPIQYTYLPEVRYVESDRLQER